MTISHRIVAEQVGEHVVVHGYRCDSGCVSSVSFIARCPYCARAAVPATFGPNGSLWSKTTLRLSTSGYTADRPVGYIDLDDGPRIACELNDEAIPVGAGVVLRHINANGDPVAVKS